MFLLQLVNEPVSKVLQAREAEHAVPVLGHLEREHERPRVTLARHRLNRPTTRHPGTLWVVLQFQPPGHFVKSFPGCIISRLPKQYEAVHRFSYSEERVATGDEED